MGNKAGRALRRGVALGLGLVAAWGVSLTADLGDMGGRLRSLGEQPTLAVSLMASQLGPPSAGQLPPFKAGGGAGHGAAGGQGGPGT